MKMRRARNRQQGVIGLDMSLKTPAACWIPANWKGDTSAVKMGYWPDLDFPTNADIFDKAKRWRRIREAVTAFVEEHKPVGVFVENYAFSARSSSVTKLAELGGIIRDRLYETDPRWLPVEVTASQARKVLLQRVPQKDSKLWTIANVRRLKGDALTWSVDECDALVVANYGLQFLGYVPLSFPGID